MPCGIEACLANDPTLRWFRNARPSKLRLHPCGKPTCCADCSGGCRLPRSRATAAAGDDCRDRVRLQRWVPTAADAWDCGAPGVDWRSVRRGVLVGHLNESGLEGGHGVHEVNAFVEQQQILKAPGTHLVDEVVVRDVHAADSHEVESAALHAL